MLSASIYNKLGTQLEFSGLSAKIGAHALVGGLIAELAGGDFKTGALAAGANEAFVSMVGESIFAGDAHNQLLALTSQLIGVSVAAAAGGSDKDQAVAGWVAQQATKFNYLEHEEKDAFVKDMTGCGTDDKCSKEKWEQGKYDEDSQGNVEYANDITGSMRAKETRDRVLDSLDSILAMPCENSTCEGYKQILVQRSLDTIDYLSGVIKDWAPTYDRLGLMNGAAVGAGGAGGSLQSAESAALSRIEKAVDYLSSGHPSTAEDGAVQYGGAKVIAQYGPLNEGPLPSTIADTFRSGTYAEVVTQQPTVLYRAYGGTAKEMGGYWTATEPAGPVQSIVDSALSPQWGNTAVNVVKIEVPAGTKYFEGVAAPQGGLVGGGSQVLFPKDFNIDPSWVLK